MKVVEVDAASELFVWVVAHGVKKYSMIETCRPLCPYSWLCKIMIVFVNIHYFENWLTYVNKTSCGFMLIIVVFGLTRNLKQWNTSHCFPLSSFWTWMLDDAVDNKLPMRLADNNVTFTAILCDCELSTLLKTVLSRWKV